MTESPCHTLDAYLDGDLSDTDATAFEAHAETCSDCTADLAASHLLEAEWAHLAAIPCPPARIDSALREAKRGAVDRQPVPAARLRVGRLTGLVAFGVLLIALASAALWMQRDTDPNASLQASAETPTPIDTAATPPPDVVPTEEIVRQPEAASMLPAPSPTPRAAPVRRQRVAPAPRSAPVEPVVEPPVQFVNTTPPADSVAQAKDDLMLALALVADAQSRARQTVSTEIGRAAGALTESSVF